MSKIRGDSRGVFCRMFDNPGFQKLPPPARLLLLTTRQCMAAGPGGIFRYYVDTLCHQSGLTTRQIHEALKVLAHDGWIVYDETVIWVVNGLRYDPYVTLANPNHRTYIVRQLESLPKSPVVLKFCTYYKIAYPSAWDSIPVEPRPEADQEPAPPATTARPPAPATTAVVEFDRFWAVYPRKEAKDRARKAWHALEPDPDLLTVILSAVETQSHLGSPLNPESGARYIPLAATWLNGKRWEDQPATATGANAPTYEPPLVWSCKDCNEYHLTPKAQKGQCPKSASAATPEPAG